jgi:hypothetical protein
MRAQLRVLAALQAAVEGPAGSDVDLAAELALLRVQGELLASRVDTVEEFARAAAEAAAESAVGGGGGAGETGGDAGPAGRHLGDEIVEPEGGDVDRGDEGML